MDKAKNGQKSFGLFGRRRRGREWAVPLLLFCAAAEEAISRGERGKRMMAPAANGEKNVDFYRNLLFLCCFGHNKGHRYTHTHTPRNITADDDDAGFFVPS